MVISNDEYNQKFEDILVCAITSNVHKDIYSTDLQQEHLKNGILPEASVVKVHKIVSLHQSLVIKKFGEVTDDYFKEVIKMLHKLT